MHCAGVCNTGGGVQACVRQAGVYRAGACPGGGPKGPGSPLLEIEKQKKVIRANFKLFHLYFATFLVGSIVLSAIF